MKILKMLLLALLLFQPSNSVIANGQDVCPNSGNGRIKIDNLKRTVVITTVDHELFHVSVRVVQGEVTETPVVTETPNPTATPGDVITEVNAGASGIPLILFGIGGLTTLAMIAVKFFWEKTVI